MMTIIIPEWLVWLAIVVIIMSTLSSLTLVVLKFLIYKTECKTKTLINDLQDKYGQL